MALLEIEDLEVAYGEAVALRNVSLSIEQGTIVSVLGANGSGKTTLLRTISGLIRARRGTIRLNGEAIEALPVHRIVTRGISQAPEGRGIFAELTVLENLRLGAYTQGRAAQARLFDEIYEMFPVLLTRSAQQAGMLSGGEQQMLAIARCLLARPRLLMIDELSLGLAPIVTRTLMQLLQRVKAQGVTILLVEQSIHQALHVSDKVYVLANGNIVFNGSADSLGKSDDLLQTYLGMDEVEKNATKVAPQSSSSQFEVRT